MCLTQNVLKLTEKYNYSSKLNRLIRNSFNIIILSSFVLLRLEKINFNNCANYLYVMHIN